MTTHSSDVFDAFIAAKAAMDKVPTLEAEIRTLTDNLKTADEIITIYRIDTDALNQKLASSNDRISSLEASLDSSNKRSAD